MPRRVDVYFSLISPWAHLGNEPFLALAAKHGFEIGWKPVPLGGLFSETGGLPLAKRAIERQRYRFVELRRWAEKRGRPLNLRPKHWPFDASLADRAVLALLAEDKDPSGFVCAAGRGAWEEERDMADRETISQVLTSEGCDADAVLVSAETPEIVDKYRQNGVDARQADAFGSPTYVLDGESFWGQDRLEMLDDALTSGRGPYRADF